MFKIPTTTDEIRQQQHKISELIAALPEGTEMAGNPLVGALLQGDTVRFWVRKKLNLELDYAKK